MAAEVPQNLASAADDILEVQTEKRYEFVFRNPDEEAHHQGPVAPSPEKDVYLVAFTEPVDRSNPKNWPKRKKWAVTGILSSTGFVRIMVSTIMAPALPDIATELHLDAVEANMGLSVYLLATAFGPLVIGPLSEVYGRKPVLHATNAWFLVWNLVCGFAHSKAVLLSARLLAGFGASAIYALAGGVLGDLWRPDQRGRSLGLYILIPLLAVAVGPILGGLITGSTTWRWIFWSTSIVQVIMNVMSIFVFDETYAAVILQRKAENLRNTTGENRYYTLTEKLGEGRSAVWILQRSLTRPLRLLLFHPIVQVQACLSAFNYGITYLVISIYSDLWTSRYNESVTISGLHYISMCIGEVSGAMVGGVLMDFVFRKLKAKIRDESAAPEFRMPLMLPAAALTPIGLLMYGWAAEKHTFWLVVDLGAAILCFGMTVAGQALQAYVIDAYSDHTSSASAASQFLRSLSAFGFPLFAPAMYSKLGYGWGNTLLAFVAIGIGFPAPLLIWVYGARLRKKAQSSY